MLVGFQILLDMGDTVFDLMAIVDMQVTRSLASIFIDLDDGLE